MPQLLHQGTNITITLSETAILAKEWISIQFGATVGAVFDDIHARIVKDKDGFWYLEAIGGTSSCNGSSVVTGKREKLEHNAVLKFGKDKQKVIFIFKDTEQQQRLQDSQRIRQIAFDVGRVKNIAEKLSKEFFGECPLAETKAFGKYLLDFLVANLRISRGVLYKLEKENDTTHLIPVFARAVAVQFTPPRSILDKVFKTKEPERFSITEVIDTTNIALSIVKSHVVSAICFPLFRREAMIGILYIDSLDEKVVLSLEDTGVLCTLLPAIGLLFHIFLVAENSLRVRVSNDKA